MEELMQSVLSVRNQLPADVEGLCAKACNMLLASIEGTIADGCFQGQSHYFFLVETEDGMMVLDPTVEQFGESAPYVGPMTEDYEIYRLLGGEAEE